MTRETAASSAGPGQAGRNGHAPAWPASPSPLQSRALPLTGPGPVKPPAASSIGRTGLLRPRPVAGLPVRRDLRTRGNQPAPRRGCRPARPPVTGRTSPDWRVSPGGRAPGVTGAGGSTPARAARSGSAGDAGGCAGPGAVRVSDRPGGGPVPGPARASARAARTPAAGRADGTSTPGDTARQPLSDQERAAIRQAGADDARRSRAGQGFPERIEAPAAVAVLAALLRDARPPPRTGTRRRTTRPAA